MTPDRKEELTRLGLLGLAPFAAGALALWLSPYIVPQSLALTVHSIVLAYGGIIAAYMAGMGAGALIGVGRPASEPLLPGMIAALVAWFAIWPAAFGFSLGAAWRHALLALVLVYLLLRDLRAADAGGFPAWYGPLRVRLTSFAAGFLLLIALRLGLSGFY